MIVQLIRRKIDSIVRHYWSPRVGDRIEFVRNPEYFQNMEGIQIGNQYTITYIVNHNAGYSIDICVIGDDGVEHRVKFFNKGDVRVVRLAIPRKAVA